MYERCYGSTVITPSQSGSEVVAESPAGSEIVAASQGGSKVATDLVKSFDEIEKHFANVILPYATENRPNFQQIVQGLQIQIRGLKAALTSTTSSPAITTISPATTTTCSAKTTPSVTAAPSSLQSISEILKPPIPLKRAGVHRNYRLKNFGVLTDSGLLKKITDEEENKEKEKLMKETIRNIKREKT